MKIINFLIFILSLLIFPSAYAGCFAYGNAAYYWGAPSAKIEVSYSNGNITTETPANTRIGTMTLTFSCPYSIGGAGYWQNDNFMGGQGGNVNIPLPEFNYINSRRMEHKSGWVYIVPDSYNFGGFFSGNGNSWNMPHIGYGPFASAMGYNHGGQHSSHTFGIFTSKNMPGNIRSSTQVISMLTAETGNQIVYRAGGLSPGNKNIAPALTNNSYTLKYTNTVTCSVSSNVGNNLDLGVVNIHGNLNTPLTNIVLRMSCGYGSAGGNLTSNYPSFIVPGSAYITIGSPDAENRFSGGNAALHIGNGWGIKFDTNGSQVLNINSLNSISIPVYPWKYWGSPANSADWRGAVNFIINYN